MPCMNLCHKKAATSFNVIRRLPGVPRYQLGSLNGHLGDRRVTCSGASRYPHVS